MRADGAGDGRGAPVTKAPKSSAALDRRSAHCSWPGSCPPEAQTMAKSQPLVTTMGRVSNLALSLPVRPYLQDGDTRCPFLLWLHETSQSSPRPGHGGSAPTCQSGFAWSPALFPCPFCPKFFSVWHSCMLYFPGMFFLFLFSLAKLQPRTCITLCVVSSFYLK